MKASDADLIQRVLDGDQDAFTALVNKYQKSVHALVWRKIGDFHIAEELTQDVFLKAYKRLSTLKRPEQFPGWLYVIATRHCFSWLRKKQVPTKSLDAMSMEELEEVCYAQYEADRGETAAIEQRRELVKRLLNKLPESERTVVTLYYLAEMSGAEISQFLGVSPNTVRSRLHRARQRLEKEEAIIQDVFSSFQLSPHLTENIVQEIARIKPASPSVSKPWLPWGISFASTFLVILMIGTSPRALSRFQQPYNLDATSEMTIELIDTPVIQVSARKSDTRTQFGVSDIHGKNSGAGFQSKPILLAAAQADETEDSLASERAKDSIVQIRLVRKSGKLAGVGSGFFVASDKVATNLHNITRENLLVFVKLAGKETTLEVEGVAAFDVENDLLILKVVGNGKPLPFANSDAVQINESVSTLGYPETRYKVTQGTIDGISNNRKLFRVKAEYVGGMSGAPVLNGNGEVIGVAFAGTGVYGFAVSSNILKALLVQSDSTEPLKQFRKRNPVRAYIHAGRAQRETFRGDYTGAIRAYNKAIELYPEGPDFYGGRGLVKMHLGESEAAQGNTKQALDYYNEAIADLNEGSRIIIINEGSKINPDTPPEKWRVLGYMKTQLGKSEKTNGNIEEAQTYYNKALADFDEAIRLTPEYSAAYSNRGYVKIKLGESEAAQGNMEEARRRYREAIGDCTEAIRLDQAKYSENSLISTYMKYQLEPESTDTYKNRGDAKFLLGESEVSQGNTAQAENHYRAAIKDYTEVINRKSDYALAYYNRGRVKQALGLEEEAQDDFEKAKKLNLDIGKQTNEMKSSQKHQDIEKSQDN
jgi:RNA polymerase sigma factor (sigma-70 family)